MKHVGTQLVSADVATMDDVGGGGTATEAWTYARLDADLAAFTATALANATGLALALDAGVTYEVEALVLFQSAATTTGLRLGATTPAATYYAAAVSIPVAADGTGGELQGWLTSSGDSVLGTGVQALGTTYVATLKGILRPSAAGTLQIQVATEIASSAVTVKAGSVLKVRRAETLAAPYTLPSPTGQGGKVVAANAGGTGYELVDAPSGGASGLGLRFLATIPPDAFGNTQWTHGGGFFAKVPLSTVIVDTDGAWSAGDYWWTCPEDGFYEIDTKVRITDNSGVHSVGQGGHTTEGDYADFLWFETSAGTSPARNGSFNSRRVALTAGQQIRLVCFCSSSLGISAASMSIVRLN